MDVIKEKTLSFNELDMPNETLYRFFGYGDSTPDDEIVDLIKVLLDEAASVCIPKYGYVIVKGHAIDKDKFYLGGKIFTTGRVINKSLAGYNNYIMLVATAGVEFTEWLKTKKSSDDVLTAFISDGIGSAIAEATVSFAIEDIRKKATQERLKITNSYSPGYCDWHVREQHFFFSMLPDQFCGITLNDSALMHPIKSISCVIGLDENAIERPYGCSICNKKDCFLRIAKSKTPNNSIS